MSGLSSVAIAGGVTGAAVVGSVGPSRPVIVCRGARRPDPHGLTSTDTVIDGVVTGTVISGVVVVCMFRMRTNRVTLSSSARTATR